jgi:transcriptional regulator NrdR family protein
MGQVCPQCGGDTGVIDTRPYLDGVRRRRECQACGYRYSTLEYSVAYIEELRGGDVALEQRKAQKYDKIRELLGIE